MSAPRVGRLALLAVLVPVLLAGAGAWLRWGTPRAQAAAAETAAAGAALDVAADAFVVALAAASATPVRFAPSAPAAVGSGHVAEAQGLALAARGDAAGAIAFLQHAQAEHALSALGSLALGRCLAASGETAGALDAWTRSAASAEALGGVPVAVLAALLLADAGGAGPAASLRVALGEGRLALPAAAVAPVLDALAVVDPATRTDAALTRLALAARAWLAADGVPEGDAPGPEGSVIVVREAGPVLIDADAARDAARSAFTAASAAHPTIDLRQGPQPDALAQRAVPVLAQTWSAAARGVPASVWLARAGVFLLVLAAVAFALGQLTLSRLVRREVQLARMRSEFVDAVSHELRTPLAAMSLRAEVLARGEVPRERLSHYLHVLHLDVRRLAAHVQRVLDFARLERGQELACAPVPLRTVLADGVRQGLPALRFVGQRLAISVPRALPTLLLDRDVLARALRNLLENAARYAPPGSCVELRVASTATEVAIEVADRGPGVPRDERDTIFAPFQRGSAARGGGSGLGLALVRRALDLHGGTVEIDAHQGGGAVFRLRLPLTPARRRVS